MIGDWNVVLSVHEGGFTRARTLLRELGPVSRTDYLNVLVMRVQDGRTLLETLQQRVAREPEILTVLARVMPVTTTFHFQSAEEFEKKAGEALLAFVPALAGKGFHVRMHRHGFKGRLSSHDEERQLGGVAVETLEKAGTPGRVTFEDPDAILAIETLGNRAGMSLWTRDDLKRFPLLRLD